MNARRYVDRGVKVVNLNDLGKMPSGGYKPQTADQLADAVASTVIFGSGGGGYAQTPNRLSEEKVRQVVDGLNPITNNQVTVAPASDLRTGNTSFIWRKEPEVGGLRGGREIANLYQSDFNPNKIQISDVGVGYGANIANSDNWINRRDPLLQPGEAGYNLPAFKMTEDSIVPGGLWLTREDFAEAGSVVGDGYFEKERDINGNLTGRIVRQERDPRTGRRELGIGLAPGRIIGESREAINSPEMGKSYPIRLPQIQTDRDGNIKTQNVRQLLNAANNAGDNPLTMRGQWPLSASSEMALENYPINEPGRPTTWTDAPVAEYDILQGNTYEVTDTGDALVPTWKAQAYGQDGSMRRQDELRGRAGATDLSAIQRLGYREAPTQNDSVRNLPYAVVEQAVPRQSSIFLQDDPVSTNLAFNRGNKGAQSQAYINSLNNQPQTAGREQIVNSTGYKRSLVPEEAAYLYAQMGNAKLPGSMQVIDPSGIVRPGGDGTPRRINENEPLVPNRYGVLVRAPEAIPNAFQRQGIPVPAVGGMDMTTMAPITFANPGKIYSSGENPLVAIPSPEYKDQGVVENFPLFPENTRAGKWMYNHLQEQGGFYPDEMLTGIDISSPERFVRAKTYREYDATALAHLGAEKGVDVKSIMQKARANGIPEKEALLSVLDPEGIMVNVTQPLVSAASRVEQLKRSARDSRMGYEYAAANVAEDRGLSKQALMDNIATMVQNNETADSYSVNQLLTGYKRQQEMARRAIQGDLALTQAQIDTMPLSPEETVRIVKSVDNNVQTMNKQMAYQDVLALRRQAADAGYAQLQQALPSNEAEFGQEALVKIGPNNVRAYRGYAKPTKAFNEDLSYGPGIPFTQDDQFFSQPGQTMENNRKSRINYDSTRFLPVTLRNDPDFVPGPGAYNGDNNIVVQPRYIYDQNDYRNTAGNRLRGEGYSPDGAFSPQALQIISAGGQMTRPAAPALPPEGPIPSWMAAGSRSGTSFNQPPSNVPMPVGVDGYESGRFGGVFEVPTEYGPQQPLAIEGQLSPAEAYLAQQEAAILSQQPPAAQMSDEQRRAAALALIQRKFGDQASQYLA